MVIHPNLCLDFWQMQKWSAIILGLSVDVLTSSVFIKFVMDQKLHKLPKYQYILFNPINTTTPPNLLIYFRAPGCKRKVILWAT